VRAVVSLTAVIVIGLISLTAATQTIAAIFAYQPALGAPLIRTSAGAFYWPWSVFVWSERWRAHYPRPFAVSDLIVFVGVLAGIGAVAVTAVGARKQKPFGKAAWATFEDAQEAGLFASAGTVIGKLDGEILCFDGPEHQLLIGASRSGKGRGHVVPTLLAWPHSALVLDVKGELADGDARHHFPGTSGFRETLGPVLRFAPTQAHCAAFNPLFEVRKGPNEVRDVQNIVEVLVDPHGDGRNQDFWDRSAKNILVGIILHVLYAEPPERKTLAVVREKLRDLDASAQLMKSTLHRLSPITNQPEVHPEVLHAAESFLAGEERLQSDVKATADNHLDRLAAAIGLSAIISVIADNAENDDDQSLGQGVGDAAAAEAARTGSRIVDRELTVRPTLRIRAGGAVRVLVTRDIQLRPYRAQ
jgi:type IV secretion system protein VirD4